MSLADTYPFYLANEAKCPNTDLVTENDMEGRDSQSGCEQTSNTARRLI